jgi:Na+/H+ antiporter NhaD/arsenite permease-like protein
MHRPQSSSVTPAAAIVAAVFVLVAVRRIGPYRLRFWQIMALGAIAMLAFRQLPPAEAVEGIDFEVMLFLFGVSVSLWQFMRVGAPLTLANLGVHHAFLWAL